MDSLVPQEPRARAVTLTEETLSVDLMDGRTLMVPLIWFPRLWYGTAEERQEFELYGDGEYIHWPALDEDLTVPGLVAGHRSYESPESLKQWLKQRSSQATEA